MADQKIGAMPDGGAIVSTDQIPIVRAGANFRGQVVPAVGSGFTSAGANVGISGTLNTAGLSLSITTPAVGGAQTAISGIIVSNTTYTSGTVSFVNSNGFSFLSTTGQGIVGSYTVPSQTVQPGIQSVFAGTTRVTTGQLSFADSNGLTWGINGQTITATVKTDYGGTGVTTAGNNIGLSGTLNSNGLSISATVAAQTAQTGLSGLQVSNTTYTSGTVIFQNANGASFGSSGANGVSLSYTVPTQTNQILTMSAVGNTTQSTSGTVDARSLSFRGAGDVSVGITANSIVISGLSQSAQTGLSGLQVSNTTYTSGTVIFQNANGASFGSSGANGVSLSYTVPVVPAQLSVGNSTGGNTSGDTGVFTGRVVFAGGNNITLSGSSNGGSATITISGAAAGGAQTAISGLIVSNTTYTSGTVSFFNSNGFSFLSTTGQGIVGSYTVPSQTTQAGSITVTGNTAANSTGTWANALVVNASTNITAWMSNGSLVFSGPNAGGAGAFSAGISTQGNTAGTTGFVGSQIQFVGSNGVSLSQSVNGASATLTILDAPVATIQHFAPWDLGNSTATTTLGNSTQWIQPMLVPLNMSATQANFPLSVSLSTSSNSSASGQISLFMGIYTRNSTSISLMSSGSQSYSWSYTGSTSSSQYVGIRNMSIPVNISATPGEYWIIFATATGNTAGLANTMFAVMNNYTAPAGAVLFGDTLNASNANIQGIFPGWGRQNAMGGNTFAATKAISAISGNSAGNRVQIPFVFLNSTY